MVKKQGARKQPDWENLFVQLEKACEKIKLVLPTSQLTQLIEYLKILNKWQRAYNLVGYSVKDYISRVILENLVLLPYIQETRIIDVGTGAGLPGMILALANPELELTLLDSNSKKINFLRQVVQELDVKNVTLVHSRVEGYSESLLFPCLVSRAFASLSEIANNCHHLLAPNGKMRLLKGEHVDDEITILDTNIQVSKERLTIPLVDRERYLVTLQWGNDCG